MLGTKAVLVGREFATVSLLTGILLALVLAISAQPSSTSLYPTLYTLFTHFQCALCAPKPLGMLPTCQDPCQPSASLTVSQPPLQLPFCPHLASTRSMASVCRLLNAIRAVLAAYFMPKVHWAAWTLLPRVASYLYVSIISNPWMKLLFEFSLDSFAECAR